MKRLMSPQVLKQENVEAVAPGARSQGNHGLGFRPAFLDYSTMAVYVARFADGGVAPFHVLDGLPDEVVVQRSPDGRVARAKATLISGFERNGFFYTRTAAARATTDWPV
jgi:hypothetical protein